MTAASNAAGELPPWTLGILAGGLSARMGRDKALIERDGRAMIEHVVARCAPRAAAVLISVATPDRALPASLRDVPRVVDGRSGCGPLSGIHALRAAAPTPWLAVIPCDMPWLEAGVVELLVRTVSSAGAQAAWFGDRSADQPFPLALAAAAGPRIGAALDAGRFKILEVARSLDHVVLDAESLLGAAGSADAFRNVNDPGECRRWLAAGDS
jgi:molybdenum cofactor guanylyltransferase